jgi:outer membrane protein
MMQQRIRAAFGVAAMLLFAAALPLQAQADTKIAVVNGDAIINNAPQAKAVQDKLKGEFEKRKTDFEAAGKQFNDDKQNFQRNADTMTPDQRNKTARDLDARQVDLGYQQQKLQEDYQQRSRELVTGLNMKIRDVIVQVAKEKGYDLVLSDAVYVNPAIDITDEVLKRLAAQPAAAPGK